MTFRQLLSVFIGFILLLPIYVFAKPSMPESTPNPLSQIKIDFDPSKGSIDHTNVSADGNTVALSGLHRILLYKIDAKSGAKLVDTDGITKDMLKNEEFIPSYYCDYMTQCRLFDLSGNGKVFGFIKAITNPRSNSLHLYTINKDNTISPIQIPSTDFPSTDLDAVTIVNKLSISTNGKVVLVQTNKGLRLYNVNLQKKIASRIAYPNVTFDATLFSISPNGKYLILAWYKYDESRKDNAGYVSIAQIKGLKSTVKSLSAGGIGGPIDGLIGPLSGLNISNDGSIGLVNDLGVTNENGTVQSSPGVHQVFVCCSTVKSKKTPIHFLLPEKDNKKGSITKADLSADGQFVYSNKDGLFEIQGVAANAIQPPESDLVFYKFSKNHKIFVYNHESDLENLSKEYIFYTLNSDNTFTQLTETEISDDSGHPSLSANGTTFVVLKGSESQINQAIIYKLK